MQGNANMQLGKNEDAMESYITALQAKKRLIAQVKAAEAAGGGTGGDSDDEANELFNLQMSVAMTTHQIGNLHGLKARGTTSMAQRRRLVKKAATNFAESLEIKKGMMSQLAPAGAAATALLSSITLSLGSLGSCHEGLGDSDAATQYITEQLAALRVVHADNVGHPAVKECLTVLIRLKKAKKM